MGVIVRGIRWIMLVSGLLTLTMLYAAVAPTSALASMFGQSLEGPVANIVVRNWGALIALVGALLVYGAFRPDARPVVLTTAAVSKLIFISLVLTGGRQFLGQQIGVAVIADAVMVLLFAGYLAATAATRQSGSTRRADHAE